MALIGALAELGNVGTGTSKEHFWPSGSLKDLSRLLMLCLDPSMVTTGKPVTQY